MSLTRRPIAGVTALVTGASGGIGQCLVRELLRRDAARVYAASRQPCELVESDRRVVPLALDITQPAQVAAAARAAADVTLLVNNAGVNRNARFMGAPSLDDARAEMETNYFGTASMCQTFAPVLARNGGGVIVNVLSIAARVGMPAMGSLSASKAAALRLTECLRAELAAQDTWVVSFLPSAVDTAMTRGLDLPKASPRDAAVALLDGLETGEDEIIFGVGALRVQRLLATDPRALERELAAPFARAAAR